jgi:xylan 1,4-beta-xylosidase
VQGGDYVVTRTGDELRALFWNFAFYNDEYLHDKLREEYYKRYIIFSGEKDKTFILNINNSFPDRNEVGDYILEKMEFNREYGSIFDLWLQNGAFENLSEAQKNLLKRQCAPKESLEIIHSGEEQTYLTVTIPAHGFTFCKITPLEK